MHMELLPTFIQFAWQRRNIHSRMTHPSKMLLRASPFLFVKCACLLALVSYTLSSVTCKPCQALAHGQVSLKMYCPRLSHEKLCRILGSRTWPTDWACHRIVLDAFLPRFQYVYWSSSWIFIRFCSFHAGGPVSTRSYLPFNTCIGCRRGVVDLGCVRI
jgi:hypothetical protein